jgi:predicted Fe-Mo cluster-binding NifX family protein
MILISLEEDKKTISSRFRKATNFAFLEEEQVCIKENPHKTSKSNEFFEYFNTLKVRTVYLKELGYKTFLKLEALGVEVYFVQEAMAYNEIEPKDLLRLDASNAEELCSLGHHKK